MRADWHARHSLLLLLLLQTPSATTYGGESFLQGPRESQADTASRQQLQQLAEAMQQQLDMLAHAVAELRQVRDLDCKPFAAIACLLAGWWVLGLPCASPTGLANLPVCWLGAAVCLPSQAGCSADKPLTRAFCSTLRSAKPSGPH